MWTPAHSLNNAPMRADQHKPNASATFPNGGTYIGKSLLIKGEVSGSEPLHIEGRIEGSISLPGSHVSIGRDGVAVASVEAAEVVVCGELLGNLTASVRLELHSGASVVGEMVAPRIRIEDGAQLQGKIDTPQPEPTSQPQEQDSSRLDEAQPLPALAAIGVS